MNPFYEQMKQLAMGGNGLEDDIGDVYKGILYQRGYGLGYGPDFNEMYGLGFGDSLMSMFRYILPTLKSGAKYLGEKAITAAADIAQDAIAGRNIGEAAKEHVTKAGKEIFGRAPPVISDTVFNKGGVKRKLSSRPSAGELVAGARKKKRKIGKGLLATYPALEKIL